MKTYEEASVVLPAAREQRHRQSAPLSDDVRKSLLDCLAVGDRHGSNGFSPIRTIGLRPKYVVQISIRCVATPPLTAVQEKKPVRENGRRKHKNFQWLTEEIGNPRLKEHLRAVEALMKAFDSYDSFYVALQRALPKQIQYDTPLFDVPGLDAVPSALTSPSIKE